MPACSRGELCRNVALTFIFTKPRLGSEGSGERLLTCRALRVSICARACTPNPSTSCSVRQYRHSANATRFLLPSYVVSSVQCILECRTRSHALLAVTYPYYEFPEFPWPDALIQKHRGAVTPPAPAVQQYIEVLLAGVATPVTVLISSNLSACLALQMYTKQFQLEPSISFSTSVTKLWQTAGTLCKSCHSMAAYMHAAFKAASIYFTLLRVAFSLMTLSQASQRCQKGLFCPLLASKDCCTCWMCGTFAALHCGRCTGCQALPHHRLDASLLGYSIKPVMWLPLQTDSKVFLCRWSVDCSNQICTGTNIQRGSV